jgi:hypothetical protein
MNEEDLSGLIVGTSFGGIILVIVVSVSVGNLPHVFNLGDFNYMSLSSVLFYGLPSVDVQHDSHIK